MPVPASILDQEPTTMTGDFLSIAHSSSLPSSSAAGIGQEPFQASPLPSFLPSVKYQNAILKETTA